MYLEQHAKCAPLHWHCTSFSSFIRECFQRANAIFFIHKFQCNNICGGAQCDTGYWSIAVIGNVLRPAAQYAY